MKKLMDLKSVVNKAKFAAIALVVMFTITSAQTFAGTNDEGKVEFKYLGSTNNQPVFLLNLNNIDTDVFEISLKNAYGEIFFSEKVSGQNLTRQYRLDTDELDATRITVEVFSKKNRSKVVYTVDRNMRIVEDVVINKL